MPCPVRDEARVAVQHSSRAVAGQYFVTLESAFAEPASVHRTLIPAG
ncbi:hypothetical protein [Streptomyces sp. NPDC048473]